MLDPLVTLTFGMGLAWVFAVAVYHKLRDGRRFRKALFDYGLIGESMVGPVATTIVLLELGVVVGWLAPASRDISLYLAAALLSGYAAAMSLNLRRGRKISDCGCMSAITAQPLSWWMVGRNVALVLLALLAVAPVEPRLLSTADVIIAAMTVSLCAVLYELHATMAALNTFISRGRA